MHARIESRREIITVPTDRLLLSAGTNKRRHYRSLRMSTNDYTEYLKKRAQGGADSGFEPTFIPGEAFPFQRAMIEWAVRKGRAALFEDCGLGKTLQLLAWGENVVRHTNGNVLVLTPLAVTRQTIREAEKFGIDAKISKTGSAHRGITVTNYEKLHLFNYADFEGVICDESSILKNFDGRRKKEITDFSRKIKYRLLDTATAAPNDYMELGTSSEALGYLGYMDMLNKFFRNDRNNSANGRMYGESAKWEFKGHSELAFWRWVTSWARAIRKPSDLGFDDNGFILPELIELDCLVPAKTPPSGMLFDLPAINIHEQREERRRTIVERCEKAAELVADKGTPSIIWCHLNAEGDLLEKIIPGAVQVAGKHSDEQKEERLNGFSEGEIRALVIKPKIGAFGLNYQHCSNITYFPSHSYEQYYQAVRRCWRFGQKRTVTVNRIMTEGDRAVMANLQRKSIAATVMFDRLVEQMNNAQSVNSFSNFDKKEEMPQWL